MTEEQWGIDDMDFSQAPVNTSSVRKYFFTIEI